MPRLVIDSGEENSVSTRELRDEDVADETLRFDDAGRTQDLDSDVADAYAAAYDNLRFEDEVVEAALGEVGELLSGTVDDIEERIESGDFDDRLDDVGTREQEGDGRVGVQEAIEARRIELQPRPADETGDSNTETD